MQCRRRLANEKKYPVGLLLQYNCYYMSDLINSANEVFCRSTVRGAAPAQRGIKEKHDCLAIFSVHPRSQEEEKRRWLSRMQGK